MRNSTKVKLVAAALGGIALAGCGSAAATKTAAPAAAVTSVKPVVTPTVTKTPKPVPTVTRTVTPRPVAPARPAFTNSLAVVAQFYQDLTNHDYPAAWSLGGKYIGGQDYNSWVAGYSTTASITLTGQADWNSGAVLTDISAVQSDGSVRTYSGTYYVSGGVIRSADIAQTSDSYAPAAAAPGDLKYCEGDLYAGPNTSCAFALNVATAANAAGLPYTVDAYSPVTGQTYTMTRTSDSPLIYTGGNGALVEFGS